MSRKFLVAIDLGQNQLLNVAMQSLASAPGTPVSGQFYYNSTSNQPFIYNGTIWIAMTPATFTPGSYTLDQFAAAAAAVSMGGFKITNLATPTLATDATTKGYVDGAIQGLNIKGSVFAATTVAGGNNTLTGTQTVDGIALIAGNRVLVKNQTTVASNGIYIVAAGAWTRSTDQAAPAQGDFVFIEQGTVNAAQGWSLLSGATTWTQFSAAGEYTQGAGITITAGVIAATAPQKYTQLLTTSSTTYTITHSLGTLDVLVQVYTVSDGSEVMVDNLRASTTTVTLNFATAPAANAYRVVIIG